MHFSKLFAPLALASTAFSAATPQQIADGIKLITQKSAALQAPAQSITALNAPLIAIGGGPFPTIIAGFQDIISTANTIISQLPGTQAIQKRASDHPRDFAVEKEESGLITRAADADLVFDTFREFVRVHQALLNILIGKAGILAKVPVIGQPVATVLRGVEGVVDTIAINLINLTQARAGDLTAEANTIDATLVLTIQSYDSIA
ncbi:hypothetical protein F5Y17DRAFT_179497 [Xylariaceae sp. FL0594]|nr:hypothetical protein F5Y17DRAFT_179497 [Xylariaceae sp. FL0594]